ncbi:hypothetical protein ACHAW5_010550 [Stephanodiscus triporus]|uniref:MOSC domain-containing protein n=1 Tax=Stephanodiscus triporus TaxID=2934178 RepID=A0ABD3NMZ9_9STRA
MEALKTIAGSVFGESKGATPTVTDIFIYPIKSCGACRVGSAAVTPRGFHRDRIFQVVNKVDGAWHYCTPREKSSEKLFHIAPSFSDDGRRLVLSSLHAKKAFTLDLEGAPTTPLAATTVGSGGSEATLYDYGSDVADWLQEATDIRDSPRLVGISRENFTRIMQVNPDQGVELPMSKPLPLSLADEAPFLLATHESLSDLNKRLELAGKETVDMRRFRPNIVIGGMEPWEEDSLKRIKIGPIEFLVWQRCGRCTMTTIDRDTLKRSGEPLNTLSSFRERSNGQRNFGMHLIPVLENAESEEFIISVGDKIEILEYDEERRSEWMQLFGKK